MKQDKETKERLRLQRSHNELWAYFEENLESVEAAAKQCNNHPNFMVPAAMDFLVSLLYARREEARQLEDQG